VVVLWIFLGFFMKFHGNFLYFLKKIESFLKLGENSWWFSEIKLF